MFVPDKAGGGGGQDYPVCVSCGLLITDEKPDVIEPNPHDVPPGLYHPRCAKPLHALLLAALQLAMLYGRC